MEELKQYANNITEKDPYKLVFSKPKLKTQEFIRAVIVKKQGNYQIERFTQKQAFHENIQQDKLSEQIVHLLSSGFSQLTALSDGEEVSIGISKKGKVLFSKRKSDTPLLPIVEHNNSKHYLLKEGEIIPPLIDMGVMTKDGKVIASMYDKFKQINRFAELINDVVKDKSFTTINIIDFGCGKSYLTFVLYYFLRVVRGIEVSMLGLDLKQDVIEKCNATARKYGYTGLSFELGDIKDYKSDGKVDMVISLHACDIATDLALYNAISWGASMIFSVPCCQHELNEQINSDQFSITTRYGIVKERISALYTDAIRANLLECCGYKTQLLEFVDFSHTPKNILIRAVKSNITKATKTKLLEEVNHLISEFNLSPMLYNLLSNNILQIEQKEN